MKADKENLENLKGKILEAWEDEAIGAFSTIDFIDYTDYEQEIEAFLQEINIQTKELRLSPYFSIDFKRD